MKNKTVNFKVWDGGSGHIFATLTEAERYAAEKATNPATVNLFEIVISNNRPQIRDNGIIYENKAQQEINNR